MGAERKPKQTVYDMYMARSEGDILMDAPTAGSCRELQKFAEDRNYWSMRVRKMRQPRVRVEMGSHVEKGAGGPFTVIS